jgi:hypothetical protein
MIENFIILGILYLCMLAIHLLEVQGNKWKITSREILIDAQHSLIKALYQSVNLYRIRAGEDPLYDEYSDYIDKMEARKPGAK